MSFIELILNTEYRSSIALTSRDFYAPILKIASRYDRAVGFFSSSSLVHIAEGLLPFVNNGGTMRLVASPILNKEDVEATGKDSIKNAGMIISYLTMGNEMTDMEKNSVLEIIRNATDDEKAKLPDVIEVG